MGFPKRISSLQLFSGLLSSTLLLGSVSLASAQSPLTAAPLASIPSSITINLEGERVQVPLQRFRPDGVPIEMGVPENSFVTRVDTTPVMTRVRLSAGRNGQIINDDARINIIWFDDLMELDSLDDVEAWLHKNSRDRNIELQPIRNRRATYSWVSKRWRFERSSDSGDRILGKALIGQLGGKYFIVVHQLPVDMLEGYGPRVDAVLRTLRSR
ncbi:MAG: hypothetical protein AAGA67_12400 [Cyanobacteria bacterium P01_F01_bin.153]